MRGCITDGGSRLRARAGDVISIYGGGGRREEGGRIIKIVIKRVPPRYS